MAFIKATKKKAKGRLSIEGPAGAGKTRTALKIAEALVDKGQRVAFIDTEAGSASKYSHLHDFDVLDIEKTYEPKKLTDALQEACDAGYGVAVVDSLTHFWKGPKGFLDMIEDEVARMRGRGVKADSFAAWKIIDPIYVRWITQMWTMPIHIIFTLRSKMTREKDQTDGKIKTVGYQPEMRDDFIYLPDVQAIMDADHRMVIGKNRVDVLDGKVFHKPGEDFAAIFKSWLEDGSAPPAPVADDFAVRVAAAETEDAYRALVDEFKAKRASLPADQQTTWHAALAEGKKRFVK